MQRRIHLRYCLHLLNRCGACRELALIHIGIFLISSTIEALKSRRFRSDLSVFEILLLMLANSSRVSRVSAQMNEKNKSTLHFFVINYY